jgi:Mce-associated membrane protein
MSTQQPGPRRRRIAGERRTGRGVQTPERDEDLDTLAPPSGAPVTDEPVAEEREEAAPAPEPRKARRARKPRRTGGGWLGRRSSGRWGSRGWLIGLTVLLALLLAVSAAMVFGLFNNNGLLGIGDLRNNDQVSEANDTAPSTAERAASVILAYDYRSLDADRAAAIRYMTPHFADQYKRTFDKVVRSAAVDSRAKVTADVKASSVIRATPDRVRVLVFVDQTTQSNANPGPQQALNRVEMVMVRSGSDWLVDDITSY